MINFKYINKIKLQISLLRVSLFLVMFFPSFTFSQNYLEWPKTHSEKIIITENSFLFKEKKLNTTIRLKKPFVLNLKDTTIVFEKITYGEELFKPYEIERMSDKFNSDLKNDNDLWQKEIVTFDKDGFPLAFYRIALGYKSKTIYLKNHYNYLRFDTIIDKQIGDSIQQLKITQLLEIDKLDSNLVDSEVVIKSIQFQRLISNKPNLRKTDFLFFFSYKKGFKTSKFETEMILKKPDFFKTDTNIYFIYCLRLKKNFYNGIWLIDSVLSNYFKTVYWIEIGSHYQDLSINYDPFYISCIVREENKNDTSYEIGCESIQKYLYSNSNDNWIYFNDDRRFDNYLKEYESKTKNQNSRIIIKPSFCFNDELKFSTNKKKSKYLHSYYYNKIATSLLQNFDSLFQVKTKSISEYNYSENINCTFESFISDPKKKRFAYYQTIKVNFPDYDWKNKKLLGEERHYGHLGYNIMQLTENGPIQFYVPHYLQLFYKPEMLQRPSKEFTNKTLIYKLQIVYYGN